MGLYGHRLLEAGASGEPLIYSLTLYERGDGVNHLRVQADNLDQPFDINQGAKLDLGSTAKLRTLITYLEIVAELHAKLGGSAPAEIKVVAADAVDPLTAWAAGHLGQRRSQPSRHARGGDAAELLGRPMGTPSPVAASISSPTSILSTTTTRSASPRRSAIPSTSCSCG